MLIIASMINATGETIAITFVKETWRIVVNINPRSSMNSITPDMVIRPREIYSFLLASAESLCDRYTKNPGYNGKTQTAPTGVSKPNTNDVAIPVIKSAILTSFFYFLL